MKNKCASHFVTTPLDDPSILGLEKCWDWVDYPWPWQK